MWSRLEFKRYILVCLALCCWCSIVTQCVLLCWWWQIVGYSHHLPHTRQPSKCIEDDDELDVDEQAHPGLCGTFEKPRMLSAPHQPPNPGEEFAQIPSLPVTELELVKFELVSKLVTTQPFIHHCLPHSVSSSWIRFPCEFLRSWETAEKLWELLFLLSHPDVFRLEIKTLHNCTNESF